MRSKRTQNLEILLKDLSRRLNFYVELLRMTNGVGIEGIPEQIIRSHPELKQNFTKKALEEYIRKVLDFLKSNREEPRDPDLKAVIDRYHRKVGAKMAEIDLLRYIRKLRGEYGFTDPKEDDEN